LVIDPPGEDGIVHETVAPLPSAETPNPVGAPGIIASGSGVGVTVGVGVGVGVTVGVGVGVGAATGVGVGVGVGVTVGVGVGTAFTSKLSLQTDQIPEP